MHRCMAPVYQGTIQARQSAERWYALILLDLPGECIGRISPSPVEEKPRTCWCSQLPSMCLVLSARSPAALDWLGVRPAAVAGERVPG